MLNTLKVLFLFVILFPQKASCQKTTQNWLFYNQLRFEFTNGTVLYNPNNPSVAEDRTTIFSHPKTGELMLYFDGTNLWSGEELTLVKENIKEGSGLRQASLILPVDKSLESFYLFTCHTKFDEGANLISSNLTYSYISKSSNTFSVDSMNLPLNSNISPNVTAYPLKNEKGF